MIPARKYKNVKTEIDGLTFDSLKEGRRYGDLKLLARTGEISDLQVHPVYPFVVNGKKVSKYIADFAYLDAAGVRVIEDVKSAVTRKLPVYRLKLRLLDALYGLSVREL